MAAACLLIADNVGTGVLALPGQAVALGSRATGVLMVVVMAPLCWYMGVALHRAATLIERRDAALLAAVSSSVMDGRGSSVADGRGVGGGVVRVPDFFGLAAALYGANSGVARLTAFLFYLTLFLQMGSCARIR